MEMEDVSLKLIIIYILYIYIFIYSGTSGNWFGYRIQPIGYGYPNWSFGFFLNFGLGFSDRFGFGFRLIWPHLGIGLKTVLKISCFNL